MNNRAVCAHSADGFHGSQCWCHNLVRILTLFAKALFVGVHCFRQEAYLVLGVVVEQYIQYFFYCCHFLIVLTFVLMAETRLIEA